VPAWTCDIYPTLLSVAGLPSESPHPLDGINLSPLFEGKMNQRNKAMGFWHLFQGGQATWSDRILKAIMEKQQAGAPRPHDPQRMRKDVNAFPQFPLSTSTGHAAWQAWPWKLHRMDGNTYELYHLEQDPMESTDLSHDPHHHSRLERMKVELQAWMRSVVGSINGMDYQKSP